MGPLISFIVPVYNVEQYIKECIESILCQTYEYFELILIDDGSLDSSGFICDSFAEKDSRVIVVHKLNEGLSDARNAGLKKANGDFIIFVDGDDFWIGTDCLQLLIDRLSVEVIDCLCFNCCYYFPDRREYKKWVRFNEELLNCKNSEVAILNLIKSGTFPMSACLKVIRRSFLIVNDICFQKGIYSEDIPWFLSLLMKVETIRFVNYYVYGYRKQVISSISSSFSEKKYCDLFHILIQELDNCSCKVWESEVESAILSFLAYEYSILLGFTFYFEGRERENRIQELKQYTWLLNYTMNPKVRKVSFLHKLVGLNYTAFFLHLYIKYFLKVN